MTTLPLPPETRQKLMLSVGTHRGARPFTPVEVALAFAAAIDGGATLADCAEEVHLNGTSMVSRFLRLLRIDPSLRHLVDWGETGATVSFTSASELARMSAADQVEAVKAALEHTLSSSEIKTLVQRRLRSRKPIEECVEEVVRSRPIVETRHVVVGAVVLGAVSTALATLTQAQRNELLALVLSRDLSELPAQTSRLGTDRFTLVGGDELGRYVAAAGAELEQTISTALLQEISE